MKVEVRSARIVPVADEGFPTRLRIVIENTRPNYKDDDFEFCPLACELSDNFGNVYSPSPPTDLTCGLYDRNPLYPELPRVIDLEFERLVPGVTRLVLRMVPPTQRSVGGARLQIAIPACLIEGLEMLEGRGPIVSRGCEGE